MSISYLYSSVLETKKTAGLNEVFKVTENHHTHPNVEKPLPPANIVLKFLFTLQEYLLAPSHTCTEKVSYSRYRVVKGE